MLLNEQQTKTETHLSEDIINKRKQRNMVITQEYEILHLHTYILYLKTYYELTTH